jgi:hypothetical protein
MPGTEFLAKPETPSNLSARLAEIVERPRAFVRTESYFGPDRRRKSLDSFDGPWRRQPITTSEANNNDKKAQMIAPDAFPQMMAKTQAAQFSQTARSSVSRVKAARIIEDSAEGLREAIPVYVEQLEAAGQDHVVVSDKAHEARQAGTPPPASPRAHATIWKKPGTGGGAGCRRHRPACQYYRPRHPRRRPWRQSR